VAQTRPWMVCPGNHEIEQIHVDKILRKKIEKNNQIYKKYENNGIFMKNVIDYGDNSMNNDIDNEIYDENEKSEMEVYTAFEYRYKMPAIKPAEYGKTIIAGNYNKTLACAPSVFQSEYDYGNSFYSFEAGMAHVIFLNPYTPSHENSNQYRFLKNDFNYIDRLKTPWVIVVMHCPWYNSNKAHSNENQTVQMRHNMEALFYENHVNFVVSGHVHAYERSFPVYNESVRTDGVTYVTIGDAGNHEGKYICVYICFSVYIYVYIYVYIFMYTYICIYIYVYIYIF
jgi:regulator of sigma D